MSKYRELDLLREQEQTLMQLHMNFSDQLNRLRVEELALTNLLRLQKEREMQAQTGTSDQKIKIGPAEEAIEQETMEVLNLVVLDNPVAKEEENEEEEEVEEGEEDEEEEESTVNSYNDQLTTFLEDLLTQQKEQNEQGLQLAVHKDGDVADEEEEEEET